MPDKNQEQVVFWKSTFEKYDCDHSGELSFEEVRHIIRVELKLNERMVSDVEFKDFLDALDTNGDHRVSWNEWLDFVSKGRKAEHRCMEEVLEEVARAIRLGMRRSVFRPDQVEECFRAMPECSILPMTRNRIDLDLARRCLLKIGMAKHDASNDNLKILFQSLGADHAGSDLLKGADQSGTIHLDELLEFIHLACCKSVEKEIGMSSSFQALIGGMQGLMPLRSPQSRPGSFPFGGKVGGPSTMPFCLNGRELPPTGRLFASQLNPNQRKRLQMRPSISCPELPAIEARDWGSMSLSPAAAAAVACALGESPAGTPRDGDANQGGDSLLAGRRRPKSLKDFLGNSSGSPTYEAARRVSTAPQSLFVSAPGSPTIPTSPLAIGSSARRSLFLQGDALAAFTAAAAAMQTPKRSASSLLNSTLSPPTSPQGGAASLRIRQRKDLSKSGSYLLLKGKDDLNRVEQRLFEAGVDVRGGYHRFP